MPNSPIKVPEGRRFILAISIFYTITIVPSIIVSASFHFPGSTIVSILGIIISPSAPAFLAIYFSRYSEQARAARKSEQLADIQIHKEIRSARLAHYEDVSRELKIMREKIEPDRLTNFNGNTDFKMDERDFYRPYRNDFKRALLHLKLCNQSQDHDVWEDFLTSEKKVAKLNMGFDELKKGMTNRISDIAKSKSDVTVMPQTQTPIHGAVIGINPTSLAILRIWEERPDKTRHIMESIDSIIKDKTPDTPKAVGDLELNRLEVNYLNTTCAKMEGFKAGIQVLAVIREVMASKDLQGEFDRLLSIRSDIRSNRERLSSMIDDLIGKIEEKNYSKVAECCPYREYAGEL